MFYKEKSDNKWLLIPIPDYIDFLLSQSIQNCIKRVLYLSLTVYNPGLIPKSSKAGQSRSFANFVNLRITNFVKHIIQILCMFSFNIDKKGVDRPKSFKKQ